MTNNLAVRPSLSSLSSTPVTVIVLVILVPSVWKKGCSRAGATVATLSVSLEGVMVTIPLGIVSSTTV